MIPKRQIIISMFA